MRFLVITIGLALTTFIQPLQAEINAKGIAKNYQQGVVKILLYDPHLVETFQLKKDQGYISRASGFFVEKEGYIFTNAHVVELCVNGYMILDWVDDDGKMHRTDLVAYHPELENDKAIQKIYYAGHAKPIVQVFSQESQDYVLYDAEILSMSTTFDGALIQIKGRMDKKPEKLSFTALPLGNSDQVVLGEDLIVLGYPSQYMQGTFEEELKDTLTMSFGKHSGWDYVFDENNGLIKTDASIHEGNSGGPVFGEDQKVMGIATAMGAKTRIGLIGGINAMYFVVEPYVELFKYLQGKGLLAPKKSAKVQIIPGTVRPIPHITPDTPQKPQSSPKTLTQAIKGLVRQDKVPIAQAEVEIWHYVDTIDDFIKIAHTSTNSQGRYELEFSFDPNGLYIGVFSAKDCQRYIKTLNKKEEMLGVSDIVLVKR